LAAAGSHADQNYVRADTHAGANARLVDYLANIGITELWGGGLVGSFDGLRFRFRSRRSGNRCAAPPP
jgi:hypothetical protein